MKYCEKCGNKLNEEFEFCDKCGAKVEKEEKKKETVKKEIVEEKIIPEQPIIIKTGKGKIIFLTILNILLLASTITFLVLWLTKPTNKTYSNYSNNGKAEEKKKDEKKEKNQFVGKWEQNLEYKSGNKVVQTIYGSIEFKDNYTFVMTYYDKDNKASTKEEQKGTYSINGNSVKVEWIEDGERSYETYSLKDNKLCINSNCSSYLVKNGYNSKIVIPIDEDKEEIKTINYTDYNKILNTGKDAIVVIIKDGCAWCEKFESVVEELQDDYVTPVYYYKYDGNIDVSGTPTTVVIKNGNVVDLIEGYKEIDSVESILDDLGIK